MAEQYDHMQGRPSESATEHNLPDQEDRSGYIHKGFQVMSSNPITLGQTVGAATAATGYAVGKELYDRATRK